MDRLKLTNTSKAQKIIDELYSDMSNRLTSSSTSVCPIALTSAFIKSCRAQSCGKCVPCRVGLTALERLLDSVLSGNATLKTLETIESTAKSIFDSSDCAIGYESARLVLKGLSAFYEDYISHINNRRCVANDFIAVPCVYGCPAHVDIPAYLALCAEGRNQDAIRVIRKDNPFPLVCGLVCEHPCEFKCRRGISDLPINIRGIKRYAVENAGDVPQPSPAPTTNKKVAVIGGGPSGLTCAYYLALMGHKVTIFEEKKHLGGMLRYGIPAYRLPREMLEKEIKEILSVGIEVKYQTKVNKDITLAQIKDEFDAVFISIGAQTDKKLGIDGEDAKGVMSAVEMLKAIGDENYPDFSGKKVLVVGGGNVAMDVARSSIRLGAENVKIVYRRRKDDMTAQRQEVDGAIEEGCEMVELMAPVRIEKDADNNAKALWVKPQIIGEYDRGRPKPNNSIKDEVRLDADIILIAIGQGIESKEFETYGLPVKWGMITALDNTGIKDFDGIFAGGDCVTGPATVIKAIAGGKVAAANIDTYLGFNHEIKLDVEVPVAKPKDNVLKGRVDMVERTAEERKRDFKLMEIGMDCESACSEAGRCLRCDKFGFGGFRDGRIKKW